MAQAPVGGTRKSMIRVILEVYVETHPFSKTRGGGVSWHFAELSSEARIWTQVAEDRVQSLALSSALGQFFSVGFLLKTFLLNHLSMSENHNGDIFTRLGTIWLLSNQGQTFVGVDVLSVVSC